MSGRTRESPDEEPPPGEPPAGAAAAAARAAQHGGRSSSAAAAGEGAQPGQSCLSLGEACVQHALVVAVTGAEPPKQT